MKHPCFAHLVVLGNTPEAWLADSAQNTLGSEHSGKKLLFEEQWDLLYMEQTFALSQIEHFVNICYVIHCCLHFLHINLKLIAQLLFSTLLSEMYIGAAN